MYYFVRYNTKTGEITGFFRSSSNEYVPKPLSPEEDHLEVTDPEQAKVLMSMNARASRLRGKVDSGKVLNLQTQPLFRGKITLTCNLEDKDGDGVPELPADGASTAQITATLHDLSGKSYQQEALAIRFEVSRGLLSHREVTTRRGAAEVALRAIPETVRTRITATAPGFEAGNLVIEFIPVEEFRALAQGSTRPAR